MAMIVQSGTLAMYMSMVPPENIEFILVSYGYKDIVFMPSLGGLGS